MQAQRRSFHTSPANQRSCLACPTQSRHSVCQRTVRFASQGGQASRRAYTSAMAGWPLLGLGHYCGRHVGTFLCRRQRPGHRQRCAGGGWEKSLEVCRSVGILSICANSHWDTRSINEAGHSFLSELGRRLSTISDDPRESFFFSASPFWYKGLMRSHSEALLTQRQVTMSSRSSPFLT